MDSKTTERVLEALLDKRIEGMDSAMMSEQIAPLFPDLTREVLVACLVYLENEGCVTLTDYFDDKIVYVKPSYSICYLRKLKEIKDNKWAERKWNLVQVAIGAVIGAITGMIGTFIVQYLSKKHL